MRQGFIVCLALLCGVGAACGSSGAPAAKDAKGTLTGTVVTKGDQAGTRPEGNIQVLDGSEIVATQHVGGLEKQAFRFRLPPGGYSISGSVGQLPAGSCRGHATITAGRTTHADATCAAVTVPSS